MDQKQEKRFWLGFSLIKGLGLKNIIRLREYFGSLDKAWQANQAEYHGLAWPAGLVSQVYDAKKSINIGQMEYLLSRHNIRYVVPSEADYPELLKEIYCPPAVLYYQGRLPDSCHLLLSVVGTRKTSSYGRHITESLLAPAVRQGINIVSGLALGIDTLAHQTCLDNDGQTYAVMGCGLDLVYPRSNLRLAKKITNNGCLLSEYPPGTPPYKQHFPARNRIIAGLSRATLIVEGGYKSGSMITAKFALESNRDVLAVPGNITNINSQGTNLLLKKGAHLITEYEDILQLFNLDPAGNKPKKIDTSTISAEEKQVLEIISAKQLHVDEIIQACTLNTSVINSILVHLEIKGLIKNIGEDNYIRT